MYPRAFDYFAPRSVTEAISLLSDCGEEAKLLAGGQSLIPLMKLRLANPRYLIDIGRLEELAYVREDGASLLIGALTPHASVLESPLTRERWPLMRDAVSAIGDSQVRNWGTVGGALAEADPAGDWGPVALALNAEIRCRSRDGARTVPADSFFIDAYTTALRADELITEVAFPFPAPGSTGAYLKLERRAGDFAVISVAVQLVLDEKGICGSAAIALGAAGLTPIKVREAGEWLAGKELGPDVIEKAAEKVFQAAQPVSDVRGSEEYKRAAARVLFKRAVSASVRRFRGETAEAGHV